MATENVIMAMVEKGYSRQDTHEEIRYVFSFFLRLLTELS